MPGRETRSHAATQPSGSRASGSNCTFCGGAGHTDSACPQRLQHQRVHSEHFPSSNENSENQDFIMRSFPDAVANFCEKSTSTDCCELEHSSIVVRMGWKPPCDQYIGGMFTIDMIAGERRKTFEIRGYSLGKSAGSTYSYDEWSAAKCAAWKIAVMSLVDGSDSQVYKRKLKDVEKAAIKKALKRRKTVREQADV